MLRGSGRKPEATRAFYLDLALERRWRLQVVKWADPMPSCAVEPEPQPRLAPAVRWLRARSA